jgi:hypothetical protein
MVDKQAMTQSEKLCDPCQFNTESVRSLTTLLVAKSLLSSPYLDQSSFGLFCPFQPNIAVLITLRLFYRYVRYNNLSHGYLGILNEFQANVESFGDLTLDSYLKTNGILGKVNFVSGSIKILKTIEINIDKHNYRCT